MDRSTINYHFLFYNPGTTVRIYTNLQQVDSLTIDSHNGLVTCLKLSLRIPTRPVHASEEFVREIKIKKYHGKIVYHVRTF